MNAAVLLPCVIIPLALLLACGRPSQRLDEYRFYDGPQLRLKVVRYYRNIPFNYLGEHAVVMCQSENTSEFTAQDPEDDGWRVLGTAPAQGSGSAREVALDVQDDYEVLGENTLIARTTAFNISFDACGHFINWDPGRLPGAMIDPVVKPDSCAPDGPVDCRHIDFEGDRLPRYEQISIPGKGQAGFTTWSKAYKGVDMLRVHTGNNGAVWHVDTVGLNPGGQRVAPDSIRSLSTASLDADMQDTDLVDWLESVLPPGSMVIWPDGLGACARDSGTAATPCAEIRFNDSAGNNGAIYLGMNTDPEKRKSVASFQSGVYVSGDRTRPVAALAGLGEIVPARGR